MKYFKLLLSISAGVSLVAAASAHAHEDRIGVWTCKLANQHVCGPKACAPSKVTGWSRIDFGRSLYSLCTAQGCIEYPARIIQGRVTTVDVVSKGLLGRIVGYGAFMEISAVDAEARVGQGTCAP